MHMRRMLGAGAGAGAVAVAMSATATAAAAAAAAGTSDLTGYEYVVVGSGAGGGPLAARLALAGHKTLLIEAGNDQGGNVNYTVPAYSALSSEDDKLAWNFFVRHYADDERQARDFKTSYRTPGGGIYTGLEPPEDSQMMGTLYPRTNTLGGCTAHNALITVYPHRSDFDGIADLTGDDSWRAANMRQYFSRMEKNRHTLPGSKGHGYKGWLGVELAPLAITLSDLQLLNYVVGGALAMGKTIITPLVDIVTVLAGDANADSEARDRGGGYYQIPIATEEHARSGPREFVVAVRDARNKDGSKKYPLDVRMDCHVTKVVFDEGGDGDGDGDAPRATGVEFLDGAYLYKASPRSAHAAKGKPGSVSASREVIVAGGTYNSPQILKLSGVGPAAELDRFGIKVVKDLPGVGTNLQDHYEVNVQGHAPANFSALDGCNFGFHGQDDPCLARWQRAVLGDRGTYASSGLGAAMLFRSSLDSEYDVFIFGGPVNFRGYYPRYSVDVTERHDWFTWAILKAHPRNSAGRVVLRSADPLDTPEIVFNYFDTGSGDHEHDLAAISEAIATARKAFSRTLLTRTDEVLPGPDVTSKEAVDDYIKDTAWGHHASCTCAIGADDDPMAVLDSSFRVRGVKGLRVVDASVYPRIPGTFTAVSTYMVGEKAADVILSQLE